MNFLDYSIIHLHFFPSMSKEALSRKKKEKEGYLTIYHTIEEEKTHKMKTIRFFKLIVSLVFFASLHCQTQQIFRNGTSLKISLKDIKRIRVKPKMNFEIRSAGLLKQMMNDETDRDGIRMEDLDVDKYHVGGKVQKVRLKAFVRLRVAVQRRIKIEGKDM